MIRKLLGLVFNRWVLLAVIFAALALAVWLIGPYVAIGAVHPLDTATARATGIAVIALVLVVLVAWQAWRARRTNAVVVGQLLAKPASDDARGESADLKQVRERFEQAMLTLKRARFGAGGVMAGWSAKLNGRYVYELPWYLIIGAPGSGKTTALENCGLQFPLKSALGNKAIRGVGGTRNCDWWFTDQAVLIDTAGRFTTQDSDAANDRATWTGFLQMLKRSRPRQPVNGVLVTVAIPDLLARTAEERQQYALTVRQRIQELNEGLGIRIPVYLLVTKCDLLAGFMDYFATLDRDQRAAAWGTTFPADTPTAEHLKTFAPEFAALQKRLDDGLVDLLQAERDPARRARIYGFPNQFACVQPPLQEFLDIVFSPSPYEEETLLRGVYFISGTQEGTPIDRVMGSVARTFGLERAVIAANPAGGKSFFLTRLLGEVVFAERGLAGTNLRWERRRRLAAFGAYAAIGLVSIGLLTAWTVSWFGNRQYVDEVARLAEQVRVTTLSATANISPNVVTVSPPLDAMRALAESGDSSWRLGFGLSQERKLRTARNNAYDRMLVALMLPSLDASVEERLAAEDNVPEVQYKSLKTYLMLHDATHFDEAALKQYFDADWDRRFANRLTQPQRDLLDRHLDSLLAQGASPSQHRQDDALVARLRNHFSGVPLPDRVIGRMQEEGFGDEFPDFTVVRAAGSSALSVFAQDTLNMKVPGFYTIEGYQRGFEKKLSSITGQLVSEQSWVLGMAATPLLAQSRVDRDSADNAVRRIYLQQYAKRWLDFKQGIHLLPMSSPAAAIQVAQALAAPDTPMVPLMKNMSIQTTLTAPPKGLTDNVLDKGRSYLDAKTGAIAQAVGIPTGDTVRAMEKELVDDRFADLRDFVTAPPGGKARVDDIAPRAEEARVLLVAADKAAKGGAAPPANASTGMDTLQSQAGQMPEPIRTALIALAQQVTRQSGAGTRQNLSAEVAAQVGNFCKQSIAGRYPVDRNAKTEIYLQDFAQLFGPGGKFDQVFQQKLAPWVDQSTATWRLRPVDGISLGAESGSLVQFQRAKAIQEAFFSGSAQPTIKLNMKPKEMDPKLNTFILNIDGQIVRYDHDMQINTPVVWPGPANTGQIRIETNPSPPPGTPNLTFEGPWALLHLFDSVQKEPTPIAERFIAVFNVGGRSAKLEVGAQSVRNPVGLQQLRDFQCPMGL